MSDKTPAQARRERIEAARTIAAGLLQRAQHETMKQQVRRAQQDLDEAEMWLRGVNVDNRPYQLEMVDFTIMSANHRLETVAKALESYGPDAMLIGG